MIVALKQYLLTGKHCEECQCMTDQMYCKIWLDLEIQGEEEADHEIILGFICKACGDITEECLHDLPNLYGTD